LNDIPPELTPYLTQLVFNDAFKSTKDDQGYFCIDEESQIFSAILTFYRHDQFVLPDIFVDLRDAIIDKYLLPIETSPRASFPESTSTTNTTYVRLRGETRDLTFPSSTKSKTYRCTATDLFWDHLPESEDSDFDVSARNSEGIQYVLKSFLRVMNWLVANRYDVEQWDEKKGRCE
jgi:hypothetical protein